MKQITKMFLLNEADLKSTFTMKADLKSFIFIPVDFFHVIT